MAVDLLRNYLLHRLGPDFNIANVSDRDFEEFKANPPEARVTSPLAPTGIRQYTDANGNPFALGGETIADKQRRLEQQAEAARRAEANAKPVPKSYGLSEDTPEKRAAAAKHAQEIAEKIRGGETAESANRAAKS